MKTRWLWIILIIAVGGAWRLYVRAEAPVAHDEDNYLSAARTFRELMQAGEWGQIPNVSNNEEHPPLGKLLFSLTLDEQELDQIPTEDQIFRGSRLPLPPHSLENARLQAVLASILTLLAAAMVNPVAALALSGQSVHWYFGSLAYLDALPTFLTALSAALYVYSVGENPKYPTPAFLASAACFGMGVAAKYPFALMGVALVLHALVYRVVKLPQLIGWGVFSILIFFIFNPYLYPAPLERVESQLAFHEDYAEKYGDRKWYRPIQQLTDAEFLSDNLKSPLGHGLDLAIFGLAVMGLYPLSRQKSFYLWWLVLGMVFLMYWNTQWSQHKMMVVYPYSISAGAGGIWLWERWSRARDA